MVGKFKKNMARFLTHKKFKRLHAELSVGKGTRVNYQKLVPCKQSEIAIGESSIINARLSCQKECSAIAVGNQVYIGDSSIVSSHSVIIEDHAMISFGCYITDTDGHSINHEIRRKDVPNRLAGWKDWSVVKSCPVKIEANSWIGPSVIILKGVTIGEGAIIGAGSVVTKDIPPFTVCAGNPAKIIRNLDRKKNA